MKFKILMQKINHWIAKITNIIFKKSIKEIFFLLKDTKSLIKKINLLFPQGFGILVHDPKVSILIVSFNSCKDLLELFPTLEKQTYKKFEIILVENGIEDNSIFQFNYNLEVKYIQSKDNLGFAAGNNLAFENSTGEFIALINPDTKVSKNWLLEMVTLLKEKNLVAAIAPKIYFNTRFTDIIFEFDSEFQVNLSELNNQLNYSKYFILIGSKSPNNYLISTNNKISIRLPIDESIVKLKFYSKNGNYISVKYYDNSKKVFLKNLNEDSITISIDLSSKFNSSAKWLINNAGSSISSTGPYDRGFSQYEDSQFDKVEYISALCGCSFLIRRIAIFNRNLFQPYFFAYFEDSELSHWLNSKGNKILYCPKSIVYHKHSVSSEEGSITWKTLVNRGKLIYEFYTGKSKNKNDIIQKIVTFQYSSDLPNKLVYILQSLDNKMLLNEPLPSSKFSKKIAIYNTFWNSKGGGELHALNFASKIQGFQKVYLISETNFEIKQLETYFEIDLSNCIKLVIPKLSKSITSKFDVFINSSYCSNIISYAKKSYYIVSFPHKIVEGKFLKSYKFLYNSPYTKKWADQYWKKPNSEIILPILEKDYLFQNNIYSKKKVILSVGRITKSGHNKNHDKIIEAFIKIQKYHSELSSWKLIIAGSLDHNRKVDLDYYLNLKKNIDNYNIEILQNVTNDKLKFMYSISSIYIHATGLGLIETTEPEKFEHFGISNFEALCYGCTPLVYYIGGPAEFNRELGLGLVFDSQSSLESNLLDLIIRFDKNGMNSQTEENITKIKSIYKKNNEIFNRFLDEIYQN